MRSVSASRRQACSVKAGASPRFNHLGFGLRMEANGLRSSERNARAKTSDASCSSTRPASISSNRVRISACQAGDTSGPFAASRLSKSCSATKARASGGRLSASESISFVVNLIQSSYPDAQNSSSFSNGPATQVPAICHTISPFSGVPRTERDNRRGRVSHTRCGSDGPDEPVRSV